MKFLSNQATNFNGLEKFQEMVESISLSVSVPQRAPEEVKPDIRYTASDEDFRSLGIKLQIPWTLKDAEAVCKSVGIKVDEASLVVVAEDPLLKERKVLLEAGLPDLEAEHTLVQTAASRDRVLLNRRTGFDLSINLILSKEIAPKAGFPHRLGTLLGSAFIDFRADGNGLGFNPKPLDTTKAEELGIPSSTVLFVETKEDLNIAIKLDGAVDIYIKESIYNKISKSGISIEGRAVADALAVNAAQQFVYLTSRSLQEDESPSSEAAAINLILGWMRKAGLKKEHSEIIEMIKNQPELIAAWLSSGKSSDNFERLLDSLTDNAEGEEG